MVNSKSDGNKSFQKLPFSTLVKKDKELSNIRRDYASKSKLERRKAADWEYHSEIANGFFKDALASISTEQGSPKAKSSYHSLARLLTPAKCPFFCWIALVSVLPTASLFLVIWCV